MRWRPSLPARSGWLALAAGAALALVLLALALHSGPVQSLDGGLHGWFTGHRNVVVTRLAIAITTSGSSPVVYTAVLAAVALTIGRRRGDRRRRPHGLAVVAVLAAGSLVRLELAVLVGRLRPPQRDWAYPASGYAWPSGHTTVSAIGAGLLAWWLIGGMHRRGRRAVCILAALYVAAVGSSRVYLGVHWPSDVLAGWLLAICWLSLAGSLLPPAWRGRTVRDSEAAGHPIVTETGTGALP